MELPLTRQELASAKRRKATEEKLRRLIARQEEQDEKESLRKLYMDVQQVAARRMHDISMANNREWFYSSTTRGAALTPGPGQYDLSNSSIASESNRSGIEPLAVMAGRPSFLSTAASAGPGPAAYHTETTFLDRYKNAGRGALKFTGRPTHFAMDGGSDSPGPAAYEPERIDLKQAHSTSFGRSTVPAREVIRTVDAPAPTDYDPHPMHNESGGKFAVERSEYLRRDKWLQHRLARVRERGRLPGPGHYSVPLGLISDSKAHRFSTTPARPPDVLESDIKPGPGAYFPTISVKREKELLELRKSMLKRELKEVETRASASPASTRTVAAK